MVEAIREFVVKNQPEADSDHHAREQWQDVCRRLKRHIRRLREGVAPLASKAPLVKDETAYSGLRSQKGGSLTCIGWAIYTRRLRRNWESNKSSNTPPSNATG